jgi:glycosyltransferase involved in cell wall biosynthesis
VRKKNLIIIPVFNEAWNLPNLFDSLESIEGDWDVLFINDGSEDESSELLHQSSFNFVDLPYNIGIGGCVQTGLKYALEHSYEHCIQFDGDGQHPLEALEPMLREAQNTKCDLVIGSRFKSDEKHRVGRTRRLGIRILSVAIRMLTQKHILDPTSGFRLFNRRAIELLSENYPQDYPEPESVVYLLKEGMQICEFPVVMNAREGGVSSIQSNGLFYMLKVLLSMIMVVLRPKENPDGQQQFG